MNILSTYTKLFPRNRMGDLQFDYILIFNFLDYVFRLILGFVLSFLFNYNSGLQLKLEQFKISVFIYISDNIWKIWLKPNTNAFPEKGALYIPFSYLFLQVFLR